MKRTVALFLTVVLLGLTACGDVTPSYVDLSIERSYAEPSWTGKSYTWESLSDKATFIIEADVIGYEYGQAYGYDATNFTTLAVRTSLKGDLKGNILVRDTAWLYLPSEDSPDPASVLSERSLCGEPMMRAGHRVVLFLEPTDIVLSDGREVYAPVDGAATAKFFFDEDGTYHNALLYSDAYTADTQMPVLDDMTPKTPEEIRTAIGVE